MSHQSHPWNPPHTLKRAPFRAPLSRSIPMGVAGYWPSGTLLERTRPGDRGGENRRRGYTGGEARGQCEAGRFPRLRRASKDGLLAGELRLPLVDEGSHAFLLVLEGEEGVEQPPFH